MFRWLDGPGQVFKQALPGSTNYLSAYDQNGTLLRARDSQSVNKDTGADAEKGKGEAVEAAEGAEEEVEGTKDRSFLPKESAEDLMPFPMNRQFRSQPVLSEELKDTIWCRVMEEGKSVRDVSAALGVEMRRVGAVVRLKAVEKEWAKQGKPLATTYARAVMGMLPQTPYIKADPVTHESINDLPVHYATQRQLFHPVSESRHFTRRDAGKVFDRDLKPAEDRVPHTELIQLEKWKGEGIPQQERIAMMRKANEEESQARKDREERRTERDARETTKAETSRSVFRFQDIKVENAGFDGRSPKGIGARYGIPHQDRKKGQIKIPLRVA